MSIGSNIRKQRKAKGLSQAKLAEAVGLSEPAIRLYELGKRTPKESTLRKIADVLDIQPEALRDYDIASAREALAVLFSLEEYGIKPVVTDEEVELVILSDNAKSMKLTQAIAVWANMQDQLESGTISQEEYDAWKASFDC